MAHLLNLSLIVNFQGKKRHGRKEDGQSDNDDSDVRI